MGDKTKKEKMNEKDIKEFAEIVKKVRRTKAY